MKDIPIIFSGPMVRALLDGRKTMTRRLAWRDAEFGLQDYESSQIDEMDVKGWDVVGEGNEGMFRVYKPSPWQRVKPGDRLWVRETWREHHDEGGIIHDAAGGQMDYVEPHTVIEYAASCNYVTNFKWRSPIHMPRWASRLTAIVTTTKIERLNSITDADCLAEGPERAERPSDIDGGVMVYCDTPHVTATPRAWFRELWDKLHGADAWDASPEVVALTFTVHKTNIDTLPKAQAA